MSVNVNDLRPVYVVGIGLHPYRYRTDEPYAAMGLRAIREALDDAGIGWPDVESAYVGAGRLGMAAGVPMLRHLGPTGLAVTHVENASATGSSAFRQAVIEVGAGLSDVAIAVGVDQPPARPGGGGANATLGPPALGAGLVAPMAHFAMLCDHYLQVSGATLEQIGAVAVKNHRNGSLNPNAQRQKARTLEEVLAPPYVAGSFNALQCTPIGEGAAAVIVMSEDAIGRLGADLGRCVKVVASVTVSEDDSGGNQDVALTRRAALAAYGQWGGSPRDIDVIEVHDAFAVEELLYVEAMDLCDEGRGAGLMESGHFDIGGAQAVSPSGGLLAMGHPIGPTGIGQIAEIARQLRGEAGPRQQPGARFGLAHMVGLGPVCVVHILQGAGD